MWAVLDGRLVRKPVAVAPEVGEEVPVTRGLVGGEALVTDPEDRLREGMRAAIAGTP